METELLNKILPYCGHGLKADYEGGIVDVTTGTYGTDKIGVEMLVASEWNVIYQYKPILFHPGCLTREIETEYGKEIPMIEMAKIAYNSIKLRSSEICNIEIDNTGIVLIITNHTSLTFSKHIPSNWFVLDYITSGKASFNPIPVLQYLYSRHIAFNLLSGEYVNVQSLEENPYSKIAEK